MKVTSLVFIIMLYMTGLTLAQSKFNLDSLITSQATSFRVGAQFAGKGWELLVENAKRSNYVLIGEDHFISEVPVFAQALVQQLKIENYVSEMDPWMLKTFVNKLALPEAERSKWVSSNSNGFSFFQKKNEFDLLQFLIQEKVNLIGAEQIAFMSTTILLQQLQETGHQKNRGVYKLMRDSSAVVNQRFFDNQSNPFFLIAPFFTELVSKLDRSVMKAEEKDIVDDMVRSAEIYKTGSHRNRIKFMQSNLMKNYSMMKGRKNLFKFGANHAMKGESYIPVYDIGTTAHIWAQAENQDSYHILILPRAGSQSGFLTGSNPIDFENEPFKSLKPFFEKSSNTEWTFIDIEKIRAAVRRHKIDLNNSFLEKTIAGYDALVVIPIATPAEAVK